MQGERLKHTFSAESLREKYFRAEMIDEKLSRKGFELDYHIWVETHDNGDRTYYQFLPKGKMHSAEDAI